MPFDAFLNARKGLPVNPNKCIINGSKCYVIFVVVPVSSKSFIEKGNKKGPQEKLP